MFSHANEQMVLQSQNTEDHVDHPDFWMTLVTQQLQCKQWKIEREKGIEIFVFLQFKKTRLHAFLHQEVHSATLHCRKITV